MLHPFRGVVALYSWGSLGVRLLSRTLLGLAGWLNVLVAIPPWVRRWLPWRALRRYHIVLGGGWTVWFCGAPLSGSPHHLMPLYTV